MPRHAVPCCAMLCYAVLCCALPCSAVLCRALPCSAVLCCALSCYMLCHAMLCSIRYMVCSIWHMLYAMLSSLCRVMSCHAMSCHAIPCHATLCFSMASNELICYEIRRAMKWNETVSCDTVPETRPVWDSNPRPPASDVRHLSH